MSEAIGYVFGKALDWDTLEEMLKNRYDHMCENNSEDIYDIGRLEECKFIIDYMKKLRDQ